MSVPVFCSFNFRNIILLGRNARWVLILQFIIIIIDGVLWLQLLIYCTASSDYIIINSSSTFISTLCVSYISSTVFIPCLCPSLSPLSSHHNQIHPPPISCASLRGRFLILYFVYWSSYSKSIVKTEHNI